MRCDSNGISRMVRGTAGGHRLRLRDALEQAGDGCRAGAAE